MRARFKTVRGFRLGSLIPVVAAAVVLLGGVHASVAGIGSDKSEAAADDGSDPHSLLGSYLAGRIARTQNDTDAAARYYREALTRGWPLPDRWSGYSQHSKDCLPLPTRHLSGPQVLAFRDAAFREYFDRPSWQRMVQHTFGDAALAEVKAMLGQGLARDHAAPPRAEPVGAS